MSEENFYLKNYFIKDENGRTKEEAKRHKESLESLTRARELEEIKEKEMKDFVNRDPGVIILKIFLVFVILVFALLIWGKV